MTTIPQVGERWAYIPVGMAVAVIVELRPLDNTVVYRFDHIKYPLSMYLSTFLSNFTRVES